jgi:hypothetical protein
MGYTDSQLIAAGYPPRGGGKPGLPMYDKWLAAVSSPTTIVDAQPTAALDRFSGFGGETVQSIWGGLQLGAGGTRLNGGVQYILATSSIYVPYSYNTNLLFAKATMWTGLGGDNGDTDLIQDGVELDYYGAWGANCTAWIEYFPNGQIYDPGLNCNFGDEFYSNCWVSDSGGFENPTGGWGAFYQKNVSTNTTAGLQLQRNPGPQYVGASAEFIMESNPAPSQYSELFNYDVAVMYGVAYDIHETTHDFATDTWYSELMENPSRQLLEFAENYNGVDEIVWDYYQGY